MRKIIVQNIAIHKHLMWVLLLVLYCNSASAYVSTTDTYPDSTTNPSASAGIAEPGLVERIINADAQRLAQQRQRFSAAEKALRRRQMDEFRQLATTLTDYPLYPYLVYQDLKRRLRSSSDDELAQFFSEYETLPIARLLRRKVLLSSGRHKNWQRFLRFYTPQKNARLQCHYLDALLHTDQSDIALPQIESLWLTGRSQPRICDRIFKRWREAGHMSAELVWQRLALALEEGHRPLARYLARQLPAEEQTFARLWIKLHRKPALLPKHLHSLTASSHNMAPRALMNIVKRLARNKPEDAAGLWTSLSAKYPLTEKQQNDIRETLGIALALRHLPGAETWFAAIPDDQLSDTAQQWRVRAALRQADWDMALQALSALPVEQQHSDRWQYWRARVLEQLGQDGAALEHFTQLAQRRSYYGFLAADRLGQPYALQNNPYSPSAGSLYLMAQREDVRRAREFYQLGRLVEARREWRQATAEMDNQQRMDASKLAQHWGWAEQSILTMASTSHRDDIDLRFPLLFQEAVLSHSERASIDPAWTYGVIRRESAFVPDARSPAGAVGLMQLMPATAKYLSRKLKVKYRGSSQLVQTETNLALGTRYLHRMLKRFDGQTVLATAAYNAGASRILRWLPDAQTMDAERWIENIPYRETREYVTSVLAFTVIYAERLGITRQRLSERLSVIPAKAQLGQEQNT